MNFHDSELLNTTIVVVTVRGEGRASEIPATKSARFNQQNHKRHVLLVV